VNNDQRKGNNVSVDSKCTSSLIMADRQNHVVIMKNCMELVQLHEMAVQTELLLRINQDNNIAPTDTKFPIAHVASAVLISLGVVERRSHKGFMVNCELCGSVTVVTRLDGRRIRGQFRRG
jgi:hypothetical protein